ncbi:MAG: D-glycero-alpha-D-manno-heptose-1,7-bisphosphate 7-phosphatase [Stellaceae bacterium]
MTGAPRRAVFLDRDGVINATAVINGKPVAPRRVEDFRVLPGVGAAMRRLRRAGFFICVVTNQPDIGNGLVDPRIVATMHARLRHELPIDEIEMCPHRQIDSCLCRKPKPGMLRRAAKRHRLDLTMSYMVGDRDSDVLAGAAAGCYTVFIHRGYEESRQYLLAADFVARSLSEAVHIVLSRRAWGH